MEQTLPGWFSESRKERKACAQWRETAWATLKEGRERNKESEVSGYARMGLNERQGDPTEANFHRRDVRIYHSPRALGMLWWGIRFTLFWRQYSVSLGRSLVARLWGLGLKRAAAAIEQSSLTSMEVAPPPHRSQVALLNHQRPRGCDHKNCQARSEEQPGAVLLRGLWKWWVGHSIPRAKQIHCQEGLLSIYTQKRQKCRSRGIRANTPIKSNKLFFISLNPFSNLEPTD